MRSGEVRQRKEKRYRGKGNPVKEMECMEVVSDSKLIVSKPMIDSPSRYRAKYKASISWDPFLVDNKENNTS